MKKILLLTILTISLTGCSFLPRLTMDTPNSVPQQTDRSKAKETCRGKTVMNEDGDIIECSKGYYRYNENFAKKERKYTFTEKIKNFINKLSASIFWIAIILIIFVPGALGWILSRIFNGVNKAFDQTIEAIKKFRKSSQAKEELDNYLRVEQDKETKKLIATKRV